MYDVRYKAIMEHNTTFNSVVDYKGWDTQLHYQTQITTELFQKVYTDDTYSSVHALNCTTALLLGDHTVENTA